MTIPKAQAEAVDLEDALAAVASLSAELPRGLWAMAAIRLSTIQRSLRAAKVELETLRAMRLAVHELALYALDRDYPLPPDVSFNLTEIERLTR